MGEIPHLTGHLLAFFSRAKRDVEGLVDGVQISHKIGVNHKLILMAVLPLSEFVNPFPP